MGVLVEIGVDEIHRLILSSVVGIALFSRQPWRDHFASPIELGGYDMRALLEAQTDERFHDCDYAIGAVFQSLPSLEWEAALLDLEVVLSHRAFKHLQCGEVRTREFLNHDRHI